MFSNEEISMMLSTPAGIMFSTNQGDIMVSDRMHFDSRIDLTIVGPDGDQDFIYEAGSLTAVE